MWEQYKRTLPQIQLLIAFATVGIYLSFHQLVVVAAIFFGAMQLGAVIGAMWAYRLKGKLGGAFSGRTSLNERTR